MTAPTTIEKFEQIIEIGTTFEYNWYRGHSKVFAELTPTIFRFDYTNDIYLTFSPNPELRIAHEFMQKAPSVAKRLPKEKNHLEWLFLMQHYGVPTRLLDWSENILVATFFAVIDNPKDDSEIWSMFPWKLNESHGFNGLPIVSESRIAKFLSDEIFHNNPNKLAEKYKLEKIPVTPLALRPPYKHPRYTSQQSCFTLHPKPSDGNNIPDIINDEQYLIRYIIPKNLKPDFRKKLQNLGINEFTLFPDLSGLAKYIVQKEKYIGWGQPLPLKFNDTN